MKLILKQDVQGLGYKDDVVEVKDGYGRNYLIPQGKLGHNIDRKLIVIEQPVKEVGNYTAIINLHKEVKAEVPFEVIAEAE